MSTNLHTSTCTHCIPVGNIESSHRVGSIAIEMEVTITTRQTDVELKISTFVIAGQQQATEKKEKSNKNPLQ